MKISKKKIKELPDTIVNCNNYISKIKEEKLNNYCFDCNKVNPEYISLNYAIFICGICAEYHINCFKEKRSILYNDLNVLPIKKLALLYYGGNKKLKEYIMNECPSLINLPRYQIYVTNQLAYYRKKLKFLIDGGIEPQKQKFHIIDNFGNNSFAIENAIDNSFNNNSNNNSCQNINYNNVNRNSENNNSFKPLNNINNNINILNFYNQNTNNNSQSYSNIKEKYMNNQNNHYYLSSNFKNFNNNKCNCIRLSQKLLNRNPNNIRKNKEIGSRSCEISQDAIRKTDKLQKNNSIYLNKSTGIYSKPKLLPFKKSKSKKSNNFFMNSVSAGKISVSRKSNDNINFSVPIIQNLFDKTNLKEKFININKTVGNLDISKSNTVNPTTNKCIKEIKLNNKLSSNNNEKNTNNKKKINPLKCVKISFPKKYATINRQFQTTTDENFEVKKNSFIEHRLPLSPQNDRKIREIIINTKLLSPIKKMRKYSENGNRTFTMNNDNSFKKLNVYNNKLVIEQRQPIKINLNLFKINNKKYEEISYNTHDGNDTYFSLSNNNEPNINASGNNVDIFHSDKNNISNSESNTIKVKISDSDNEMTENLNLNENNKNKNNKDNNIENNKSDNLKKDKDNISKNSNHKHHESYSYHRHKKSSFNYEKHSKDKYNNSDKKISPKIYSKRKDNYSKELNHSYTKKNYKEKYKSDNSNNNNLKLDEKIKKYKVTLNNGEKYSIISEKENYSRQKSSYHDNRKIKKSRHRHHYNDNSRKNLNDEWSDKNNKYHGHKRKRNEREKESEQENKNQQNMNKK